MTVCVMQWLVLVLYGITATLFAYCASLFSASPLAAFAAVAGYQVIMFIVRTEFDLDSSFDHAIVHI